MNLKSLNDLEGWLRSFVKALRSKINKKPTLKDGLSNLNWFLEPCQITALWFTNPEIQILIVTHFDDVEDLTIDVYGPTPAYTFAETALKVAEKEWWKRRLSPEDKKHYVGIETYRDLIENVLVSVKHFLERAPFIKPNPIIQQKTALVFTRKDFVWFIRGNLTVLNINRIVKKIVDEAKANLQQKARTQKQKETQIERGKSQTITELGIVKGYCTYMYPFLWIGEVPKLTLQQRLRGIVFPSDLRKIVQEVEILSTKTLIFNDGLIFAQTEKKKLALKIINLLAASMLINGIPAFVSRELDLIEAVFDKSGYFTHMRGKSLSPRIEAIFKPEWLQQRILSVKIGREPVLSEEKLFKVIDVTKKLSVDVNLSTIAIALLETYTYFITGNYREAFVSGWTIVEYFINTLWESLIERKAGKQRRNKLKDPNYMDIDHIIEVLRLFDLINEEKYARLMKLKNVRNRAVHKLYEPSVEDIKKLIDTTFNVVLAMLEKNNSKGKVNYRKELE